VHVATTGLQRCAFQTLAADWQQILVLEEHGPFGSNLTSDDRVVGLHVDVLVDFDLILRAGAADVWLAGSVVGP
jgi:hypothetical protein